MICLDEVEDDWIFITEDTGKCDWNLRPILFEDEETAFEYAQPWVKPGKDHNVMVVDYHED